LLFRIRKRRYQEQKENYTESKTIYPICSLPDSEEQEMIYNSLYADDCYKRKKENEEE
jgi:hypothetical protein